MLCNIQVKKVSKHNGMISLLTLTLVYLGTCYSVNILTIECLGINMRRNVQNLLEENCKYKYIAIFF